MATTLRRLLCRGNEGGMEMDRIIMKKAPTMRNYNELLISLLCDGDLPHWFIRCRDLFSVEELQAIAAGSMENVG